MATPPRTHLTVRPPWELGDVAFGWRSVVVGALLPPTAWFTRELLVETTEGQLTWSTAEVLVVLALGLALVLQHLRTPALRVTSDDLRLLELRDTTSPSAVAPGAAAVSAADPPVAGRRLAQHERIRDLELLTRDAADGLVDEHLDRVTGRRRRGRGRRRRGPRWSAAVYLRYPPRVTSGDDLAGLLVTTDTGPGHRVLLPVWRPAHGPRLVRAIATATGHVDADTAAATWPDEPRWSTTLREAVRADRGRLVAALVVPTLVVLGVWQVLRLVRAAVLDPVLGTAVGTVVQYLTRLVLVTIGTAAVVGAVVAVVATVVWRRDGRPITWQQAVELARLRTTWVLWQLRIWLAGTALLWTISGVGTVRFALGYTLAGVAVPGWQALHDVVRRTVEEVRHRPPPPLRRVAVADQWLVGGAGALLWAFLRWT